MTRYYVAIDNTPQAMTLEEIEAEVTNGRVLPQTKICLVGADFWRTAAEMLPQCFTHPPPVPHGLAPPVDTATSKALDAITEHGKELAGLTTLFARRILLGNFTRGHASAEERQALEAAPVPVRAPIAQNFAAWRRAMLWFAGVLMTISAISSVIKTILNYADKEAVPGGTPAVFGVMDFLLSVFTIAAPILVVLAALKWTLIAQSKQLARWGWLVHFFGPLLILLLPVRLMMGEWKVETPVDEMGNTVTMNMEALGYLVVLMSAIIYLLPRILGLFPGLIRSCLALRTLAPESPLPGWVCCTLAPFYILLCLGFLFIMEHLGRACGFFGILGIMATPVLIILNAKTICQPMTQEDMNSRMEKLRRRMSLIAWAGVVLLLVELGLIIHDIREVAPNFQIAVWDIITLICSLFSNIFLLTVVGCSDLMVKLMRVTHEQENALRASPHFAQLQQRHADLAEGGF